MNTIINEGIEFRQSTIAPRIYVSDDGHYLIVGSNSDSTKVRTPTKNYNTQGYPLAAIVCTTVRKEINGVTRSKTLVINIARIVLDAWAGQIEPDMEVDHIDKNPFNNHISNLHFVTKQENIKNRRKRKYVDPYWFRTEEAEEKRRAARLAKKNGTYIPQTKELKGKNSQYDDDIFNKKILANEIRKLEKRQRVIKEKIDYSQSRCDEIMMFSGKGRRKKPEDNRFYVRHKALIDELRVKYNELEKEKQKYLETETAVI